MKNRTIRISEEVWEAIAAFGKFGETEDDVLRRVFEIDPSSTSSSRSRQRHSTNRMSVRVNGTVLHIQFADGASQKWQLPAPTEKQGIKRIRDEAFKFAEKHSATVGQKQAVVHAMCDAGYFVSNRTE